MSTKSSSARTSSLRQAKRSFRFAKNRDDMNPGPQTAYVLTTRSPLDGGDVGIFGCPVVTLPGFRVTPATNGQNQSVVRADGPGAYILGRMVEVTVEELARMDQVAEQIGEFHRFKAIAKGAATGGLFEVWVYQLLDDAGPVELAASALNQGRIAA